MRVETEAVVTIQAPIERVFDTATSIDVMPDVFRGYGPIPAIQRCENLDGAPTRVGTHRHVHNSDGSVVEEVTRTWDPPNRQAYEIVAGIKPPFSFLVRKGGGDWAFSEVAGATSIRWKFYFELTSPLAWPIAALLLRFAFRKAQQRCLDAIKVRVENN